MFIPVETKSLCHKCDRLSIKVKSMCLVSLAIMKLSWNEQPGVMLLLLLLLASARAACPDGKGCFQEPAGCSSDCTLSITWRGIASDKYEVELMGKGEPGGYVAFGLPDTAAMGPAPVIVCSSAFENSLQVYSNTAYSSAPAKTGIDGIVEIIDTSEENGEINCKFTIASHFSVTSMDDSTSEIDLNSNSYNVILARGLVESGEIKKHDYDSRVKSNDQFNWGENNENLEITDQGHYESPEGCQADNCSISVTWIGSSETEYQVELMGKTASGGYVAFGLPDTSHMGPSPVIVCSTSLPHSSEIYWNTASYTSTPAKLSQNESVQLKNITETDGVVSCLFKIGSQFSIIADDNTSHSFDLNSNSYNVILAVGSVNSSGIIQQHTKRDHSKDQFSWSDNNQFITSDKYSECEKTMGCTGFPSNCVASNNCSILFQWFGLNESQYNMTIQGTADDSTYLAMGLSTDRLMGNDSVVACSSTGGVQMYWNVVGNSILLPESTVGVASSSVTVVDNNLWCTFILDATLNISVPDTNQTVPFQLNSEPFVIMLATGPVDNKTIQYHDKNKSSTAEAVELFKYNSHVKPEEPKLDYSDCDDTQGCVGLPDGCVISKNCTNLVKWKGASESKYEFSLSGESAANTYIAVGLSFDDKMGNDSVVACLDGKNVGLFWNTELYSNLPLDESMASLSNTSATLVDGIMNCSFVIDSDFQISVPNNTKSTIEFDLNTDQFHVMLASGPLKSDSLLAKHTNKTVTADSIDLSSFNSFISSGVYDNCFDLKGCFGNPDGCVTERNCKVIATYKKLSTDNFQFQIGFPSSETSGYAAMGLSDDDKMGPASAMACTINNGKIDVNMYWNSASYSSTILQDKYAGLSKITGEFNSGFVTCTFQRDAVTNVSKSGDGGFEMFDLINNEYYLLIAAGDVNANNIIQKHSLTDKTGSAIDLASYGPVARSAELMMKLHGVFMVLAWLLCSNLGVFVARYFKPQFQVR